MLNHSGIKGMSVTGFAGGGYTSTGDPIFDVIQLVDKDGNIYQVKAATLKKTRLYVTRDRACDRNHSQFQPAYHGPEVRNGTYRATKTVTIPCHTCNEPTPHTIDAEWAIGEMLTSGYTPQPGELVKNYTTTCDKCGDAQYS